MSKPRVFIGSSVEGLNVAYALQQNLLHDAEVTVWDQGVFELSRTTIESLDRALQDSDFGVFVFSPDDVVRIRDANFSSVRDNVLFEFGLFIGRLGRERVFFVLPMDKEIHLPTDLLGVTPGRYEVDRADGSLQAATGGVSHQIKGRIRSLGQVAGRSHVQSSGDGEVAEQEEKRSWIQDFVEKKYEAAKVTLEKDLVAQTGDEADATRAWLLACEMHLRGDGDITPLINFAKEHDNSVKAQIVVASIIRLEGYSSKAMEILASARSRFPQNSSVVRAIANHYVDVADYENAISELELFGPENSTEVAISLAEAYEKASNNLEALRAIQRCHARYPNNVSIRFRYARLAQDLDNHSVAIYLLNSLRVEDPNSIEFLGYLGNSCLKLDLYDMSLNAYRAAEKIADKSAGSQWVVSNIGNLFNNKGLPTEACAYLERALKIDTRSEYAHDRMASALKSKLAEERSFDKACEEGRKQVQETMIGVLAAIASSSNPVAGTDSPGAKA